MSRIVTTTIATLSFVALGTINAAAQYYTPGVAPTPYAQPVGLGFEHGIRNAGINPNVGFGLGPIGAGVGSGFGLNGAGAGANVGLGPLGVSTNGGISRHGIGGRGSAGFGNTGAAFEGGISNGGLGVGANVRAFGIGPGASIGFGDRGPSLGASVAFGRLGTLLIGSHRNSFPGAQQTLAHSEPSRDASYYSTQNYGNAPFYTSPRQISRTPQLTRTQREQLRARSTRAYSQCGSPWVC